MQNSENAVPRTAEAGSKKSLKERALSELEKYAVITKGILADSSIVFMPASPRSNQ